MLDVNLAPEVQQQKQKETQMNIVATIIAAVIVGVCIVGIIVVGGIKAAKNASLKKVKNSIEAIDSELADYKDLEETVLSLEEGVKSAQAILDGKNSWTSLLPHVEAATPRDVQFTKISVSGNDVSADLRCKNIDALSKMVDSFKGYQVVLLQKSNVENSAVSIFVDDENVAVVSPRSDGSFKYALVFDPQKDHLISVSDGDKKINLNYSSSRRALTGFEEGLSAELRNLFSNVEATQYRNDGGIIAKFSFSFDEEALW